MLTLSQFDYHLPPERIAQSPVTPRDHSKLLVVDRATQAFADKHFYDLNDILTPNDVLVINETKVFPARLYAVTQTGKKIELLIEKEVAITPTSVTFEVLTKPGLHVGERVSIPETTCEGVCHKVNEYTRVVEFSLAREEFFSLLLARAKTPIPPYIRWNTDDELSLREKYQTVYAKNQGAVAAPTAGLHFTTSLMDALREKGVTIERLTLHVGAGTFLPVKTDDISKHHMHGELFSLDIPTATRLNEAKHRGKHIIAVGTTTTRVLESQTKDSVLKPGNGTTDIFIYPPYQFQFVDGLITNFHTPKSTLLMLISAFCSTPNTNLPFETFGTSFMGRAYEHALTHDYRFYSFGDAMLIR